MFVISLLLQGKLSSQTDTLYKKLIKDKFKVSPAEKVFKNNLYLLGREHIENEAKETEEKSLTGEINMSNTKGSKEGELHCAINPKDSNNIVVSFMSLSNYNMVFYIYTSMDYGKNWKKATINTQPHSSALILGGGDPVLVFDANGKLYFTWIYLYFGTTSNDTIYAKMFWAFSEDGGLTFKRAAKGNDIIGASGLNRDITEFFGRFPDKQWICAAPSLIKPGTNNLYLSLTELYGQYKSNTAEIMVKKMQEGDLNFGKSLKISGTQPGCQYSSIVADDNGKVYLTYHSYRDTTDTFDFGIFFSKSEDEGLSFSYARYLFPLQIPRWSKDQMGKEDLKYQSKINLKRNLGNSQLAIDNSNSKYKGNLYLTWNANGLEKKEANGFDIYFSKSEDGGANWSSPKIINNDEKGIVREQHHPSVYVNNKGIVVLGWYDRREDQNNIKADYYLAWSKDGGESFIQNKVTSKSSRLDSALVGNFHIGEYTQILSSGSYIMPFWIDGRNNDGNLEVYTGFWDMKSRGFDEIKPVSDKLSSLAITPSIASDYIDICFEIKQQAKAGIEIYDIKGDRVGIFSEQTYQPGKHSKRVKINNLRPGSYFVLLTSDIGKTGKRFIRQL
ncbi:MAG: exo-alpha-sialidase [Bacteroidales bacterium]|nr:exo-alpha-sialidase [Bacteroidales bacterium]